MYYLQTRWYDPVIGRFINLDQISYLDPETVNGLNLYAYCQNNPVMGYDPEGTFAISLLVAVAVSFTLASSLSLVSQGLEYGWDEVNFGQVFVDGAFAAFSTALAATGIGLLASTVLGAGLGFAQYAIDSKIHNQELTLAGSLVSIALGGVGGYFSGRGATNWKTIEEGITGSGLRTLATNASIPTMNNTQLASNIFRCSINYSVQAEIEESFARSTIVNWSLILLQNRSIFDW